MVSWIEMFVPQMIRVEVPPLSSASDVLGLMFEKVAASELPGPSLTGNPFSSTNRRRLLFGPAAKTSE